MLSKVYKRPKYPNNMSSFIIIYFLFLLVKVTFQYPQIFENIDTCDLKLDLINVKNQVKPKFFKIPSVINVENSNFHVSISLCDEISESFRNNHGACKNVCVYDKKSKRFLNSRNESAIYSPYTVVNHNKELIHLKLNIGKSKCIDGEDYEIRLKMLASPELKKPILIDNEECQLEVQMLKPDYTPPCTMLLTDQYQWVDLRKLESKVAVIPFENVTFRLPLCGIDSECGYEAAGCQIDNNHSVLVLGQTEYRRVAFDSKNQLKIVSYFKYKTGRKIREMEIILKCDWKVPYFSNAKYIKPTGESGRKYKFEINSSFGCLKKQPSCMLMDNSNNLIYDIRSLNRTDGYDIHGNETKLSFNVCGNLNMKSNVCKYAQMCRIKGNSHENLGAIPSYEITDDIVKITFSNGQNCNQNSTFSSTINLECSYNEESPKIRKSDDQCRIDLNWRTPKACPKYEAKTNDCLLSTVLGHVNLNKLYSESDYFHQFDTGKLIFNICGKIHSNCSSSDDNVVACYVKDAKNQLAISKNTSELTYRNGRLQLRYSGENCSFTIKLICSSKEEKIMKKIGNCQFFMTFYTRSACFYQKFPKCSYEDLTYGNFDLSPLIATRKNYEIRDVNDKNVSYYVNICAPLVMEDDMIFDGDSMIHMINKSEPHVLKRFTSLGTIAGPKMIDGKLLIETDFGHACKKYQHSSFATFRFECSMENEKNQIPVLISKNNCHFEFLWKTKYACERKCLLNFEGGRTMKVTSDEIKIKIDENSKYYTFTLCSKNYTKCKNGVCSSWNATETLKEIDGELVVRYDLKESSAICDGNSMLKIVNFRFQCDRNNEFSLTRTGKMKNCQIDVFIRANTSNCNNEEKLTKLPELTEISVKTEEDTQSTKEKITNPTKETLTDSVQNDAIISHPNDEYFEDKCNRIEDFSLSNIENTKIPGTNNTLWYFINFDGTNTDCHGLICYGNEVILPFGTCPIVFNHDNLIKLNYKVDNVVCEGTFNFNMTLTCGERKSLKVTKENTCGLSIEYESNEICKFFKNNESTNDSKILNICVGVFVMLVAAGCIFLTIKKQSFKKCSYSSISRRNEVIIDHSKLL